MNGAWVGGRWERAGEMEGGETGSYVKWIKKNFEGKRNLRQSIAEEFHYLKTNSASSRKHCFQTERKKN